MKSLNTTIYELPVFCFPCCSHLLNLSAKPTSWGLKRTVHARQTHALPRALHCGSAIPLLWDVAYRGSSQLPPTLRPQDISRVFPLRQQLIILFPNTRRETQVQRVPATCPKSQKKPTEEQPLNPDLWSSALMVGISLLSACTQGYRLSCVPVQRGTHSFPSTCSARNSQ